MEKKQIMFDESMERKQVVKYLEKMVKELNEGKVIIKTDGESLAIEPQDTIRLEVEAKQKKGRERLEIELSWPVEGSGEEEEAEVTAEEKETHSKKHRFGKMIPLGLALAGSLVFAATRRMRRKSKVKKILAKGKGEGEKLRHEGEKLIAEGELMLERGKHEAEKMLKKGRKAGQKVLH